MDKEELDRMLSVVEKKEEKDGLTLTREDLEALRKLWNGEITIDEYMGN